jgi:hypothetical protein
MSLNRIRETPDHIDDGIQKLMCRVLNCPNRWSVHMDGMKPMCSAHQWADESEHTQITNKLLGNRKIVDF